MASLGKIGRLRPLETRGICTDRSDIMYAGSSRLQVCLGGEVIFALPLGSTGVVDPDLAPAQGETDPMWDPDRRLGNGYTDTQSTDARI